MQRLEKFSSESSNKRITNETQGIPLGFTFEATTQSGLRKIYKNSRQRKKDYVIQRVNHASVTVEGKVTGEIKKGYLVLLGVGQGDDESMVERYVKKLHKLRIFSDEEGKINRSIEDVGGEVLVVSQFTLYADCKKGNRPSFTQAGSPAEAERLYEYFLEECRKEFGKVEHGIFGAEMKVSLENDGPFTVIWDSREW